MQACMCTHIMYVQNTHALCMYTRMKDGAHSARQPQCNAHILIYTLTHMKACMCAHIRIICVRTHIQCIHECTHVHSYTHTGCMCMHTRTHTPIHTNKTWYVCTHAQNSTIVAELSTKPSQKNRLKDGQTDPPPPPSLQDDNEQTISGFQSGISRAVGGPEMTSQGITSSRSL